MHDAHYSDHMGRARRNITAILIAIAALVYGVSPIDVIPELLTGPLGLTDDLAVMVGAGFAVWKLLSGRKPHVSRDTPPPSR